MRLGGFFAGLTVAAAPAFGQVVGVPRFGVETPMRDGIKLVSNLWLPAAAGKFPTILIRTPYVKTPQFRRYGLAGVRGPRYAVVLQDTRGRGDSEGEFDFYFPEGQDGYDTIEWIARQPWSTGGWGWTAGSYLGTVQWLAAREHPPSLACIAPTAPSGRIFDELPYLGGAFRMEWALPWLNSVAGHVAQDELAELVDWGRIVRHRPLLTMDQALGRPMPTLPGVPGALDPRRLLAAAGVLPGRLRRDRRAVPDGHRLVRRGSARGARSTGRVWSATTRAEAIGS